MKIECGSLEYAHARVHARHGQRIDEPGWRAIEALRGLAAVLERARGTALRPWLVGIAADSAPAQIESTLRGHGLALVDEASTWMPLPWQAAVSWCAVLPELAPLQHLARGEPPQSWMLSDPRWRALAGAEGPTRHAELAGADGPWAALASAWPAPQTLGDAWLAEWRRRLPRAAVDAEDTDDADAALAALRRTVIDHSHAFATAPPDRGWLLRTALRARLVLLLRRSALGPAAVFIHLALCALDLERLRAELLRRALFPRWMVA